LTVDVNVSVSGYRAIMSTISSSMRLNTSETKDIAGCFLFGAYRKMSKWSRMGHLTDDIT